jgi:hypothetical protein
MKMCCALMRQTGKKVHPSLDGSSSILFPPANNTAAGSIVIIYEVTAQPICFVLLIILNIKTFSFFNTQPSISVNSDVQYEYFLHIFYIYKLVYVHICIMVR